jgi:hypothetical protein
MGSVGIFKLEYWVNVLKGSEHHSIIPRFQYFYFERRKTMEKRMKRGILLWVIAIIFGFSAVPAIAADFPVKPVTFRICNIESRPVV